MAVYETGNLHKAADILGVSPSAVSQNIKELGNQLGVVLFNASRSGSQPTSEADEIYKQIKAATESITNMEGTLGDIDKNAEGAIKIAAHAWFTKTFISDYMKEFCAKYPKIKITITHENVWTALKQKQVDLVLDLDYCFKWANLKTIDIFNKVMQSQFIATKSFLRERGLGKSITTADVLKLPIIEQSEFFHVYQDWLGKEVAPFAVTTASQANEYFLSMVKKDMGISAFGKCVLQELIYGDSEIVELDINPPPPSFRFVCAYNHPITRQAKTFVDGFLKFCRTSENLKKVF